MSEPRQFGLRPGCQMYAEIDGDYYPSSTDIHVIEYSAYESLKESLVLAKKQRDEFEFELASMKHCYKLLHEEYDNSKA